MKQPASDAFSGEFDPVHVARSGTFDLEVSPEKSFHLFTAPGERLWVPGWDPAILSGDGTEAGTAFVTGHGDETTIWVVTDFDVSQHRARYARITPLSRAGTVDVSVRANGSGGSTVAVRYELTALTESGNRNLERFGADAYSEMLNEWKTLIRAADIDYEALLLQ